MSEETNQDGTSFDRYLANRAPSLLWSTNAARASVINSGIGLGLIGLAVVITVIGVLTEGASGLAFGIGPALGGVINVIVGRTWRIKARKNAGETQVPTEVWKFLHGLAEHVLGPSYPFRASNMGYYPVSDAWNGWRLTPRQSSEAKDLATTSRRSAREILDPRVFEMMDAVAYQYNRVHGYLSHPVRQGGALPSDAFRIQVAADQAMIDALSIARTMQQFPENIEALRPSMEVCAGALQEASDLVGSITGTKGVAAPLHEQAVLLRGVLEDLRIESWARSELNQDEPQAVDRRNISG